jgi:hypothetical protein
MVKGETGFTQFNVAAVIAAYFAPAWHHDLLPLLLCTSVGILVSFHFGQLLDTSSWSRLCAAEEVSMEIFLIINILVHVRPAAACIFAVLVSELEVTVVHGFTAAAVHLFWGFWVFRRGKFLNLDHIYAPMEHRHWQILWVCGIAAEILVVPYLF